MPRRNPPPPKPPNPPPPPPTSPAAGPEPIGLAADELARAGLAERGALLRAEADGVDADAAIGGLARRVDRLGAGVVRPIGQEHDDGRHVGALGHGLGLGPRSVVGHGAGHAGIDEVDGVDGLEDAVADAGPATGHQAGERVEEELPVVRRRLDDLGEAAEGDDADMRVRGLALDEGGGRILGRQQAVGRDVARAHAPGDVDGQDDRGLVRRHRHGHGRSGDRDEEEGHGQREAGERQVPAQPRAPGRAACRSETLE